MSELKYLGYMLKRNGGNDGQIRVEKEGEYSYEKSVEKKDLKIISEGG